MIQLIFFLWSAPLLAGTITENFTKSSAIDATNSTATLNIVTGVTTLPPFVTAPTFFPVAPTLTTGTIGIGTGADGVFDSTTYADFDSDGGTPSIITLTTANPYQFTSVTIDSGITVKGSGSSPLRFLVHGNFTLSGTIDLSGTDGGTPNADSSIEALGGTACCGGGAGGAGGTTANGGASTGTSADAGDTGKGLVGTASVVVGQSSSGGGGGGNNTAGEAGQAFGGGNGGAGGTDYGDPHIPTLVGGSGGGGGARYTLEGAALNGSGGGGGGGGGIFQLIAGGNVTINATGFIFAQGGDGGGDGARRVGGGGGGAGGAVLIFTQGIYLNNGSVAPPAIDANRGVFGADLANVGRGGNGGAGVVRVVSSENVLDWVGTGSEEPPIPFDDFGQVKFSADANFVIISKIHDAGNASPKYDSIETDSTVPANTTLAVAMAGSSDNFVSDDTGFTSDLSALRGKQYFKFRLTFSSTDQNVTPTVRSVTVTVSENIEFLFNVKSCAHVGPPGGDHWGYLLYLLFLLGIPRLFRWGYLRTRFPT